MYFLYQKLPLTCLLHQPLMALICQTHRLCRVTRTLKVPKWQNKSTCLSKGGILFCMMHYILFRNAQFVWLRLLCLTGSLSMLFIFVLLLFISVRCYIVCSYFHTCVSLSSHSAPRSRRSRVRRHPPSSRSLSLRVRMGPSARSLYTRSLFLPSAQSRKTPLLPETWFVKTTPQISLIVSHFVTKYIDTTYQKLILI